MLVSLTVGKVDAGVAVLLTDDNRLIEFPSVLLPKNIANGSIVDITVARNEAAEAADAAASKALQTRILNTYGLHSPSSPVLRLKNATQTTLVLEWEPIQLATASLRSLSLYRNGSKAGSIPRPLETLSTKISGLAVDAEYTFQLVLKTTAGILSSKKLVCRTHKMTDLSGITLTLGILPPEIKVSITEAVKRIGARINDSIKIDTTHFVCTEGRGAAWEKAVEMNIPIVRPEWLEGCEREGTMVHVRNYQLNSDPKLRQIGPGVGAQQNRQHAILNSTPTTKSEQTPTPPQVQNRPAGLISGAKLKHMEEPPTTPFPGGPRSEIPNGLRSQESDEENEESEAGEPAEDDDEDDKPAPPTKDGDSVLDSNASPQSTAEPDEHETGSETESFKSSEAHNVRKKSDNSEPGAPTNGHVEARKSSSSDESEGSDPDDGPQVDKINEKKPDSSSVTEKPKQTSKEEGEMEEVSL
ncbi:Chitin synthase, class 5 [Myotisia sp. PD_48]|nr:Chitin synthase, class 5 [Myotisia sp. PD_48]